MVLNPAPESSKTRHKDVLIQSLGPVTKAATGDCADAKDQSGSALAFIIMGRALNWGQGALGSMRPYSHTVVASVSGQPFRLRCRQLESSAIPLSGACKSAHSMA
jgi:hypothetical protein